MVFFCLFVSGFDLGQPKAGCDAELENPNFKGVFEKTIIFNLGGKSRNKSI